MPIPRSFKVFGRTYTVRIEDDLLAREDLLGETNHREQVIRLQAVGAAFPADHQEQTFYHELVHLLFGLVSRDDLRKDEALVDLLGSMLHQVFITAS